MTVIPFPQALHKSFFIERPNRFILHCELEETGETIRVHLPDPGRLKELLQEQAMVYVLYQDKPGRKTKWTACVVKDPVTGVFVSLQTTLPNQLVEKALKERAIPYFQDRTFEAREFTKGGSRWDFLLKDLQGEHHIVEVKSVSLMEHRVGYFPDAITERGTKHVQELTSIVEEKGWSGTIVFVAQRSDINIIRPAEHIDPAFAHALQKAHNQGVRLLGLSTEVSLKGIQLLEEIPISLP